MDKKWQNHKVKIGKKSYIIFETLEKIGKL